MPLKNDWQNGDTFTPAAANDMANNVNSAVSLVNAVQSINIGTADALPIESSFWWQTEPVAVDGRVYNSTCGVDNGTWLQEWTQPVDDGPIYLQRYFLGYSAMGVYEDFRDDHVNAGLAVEAGQPLVAFWSAHGVDNRLLYRISDQNIDEVGPGELTFGPTKVLALPDNERNSYAQVMVNGTDIWVMHRTGFDNRRWSLTKFPSWATGTPIRYEVFSSADQFYVKPRMVSGSIRCMISDHPTIGADNKIWYAEINTSTGSITEADGTVLGNLSGTNLPLAQASLDLVFTSTGSNRPWGFDVGYNASRELAFTDGNPNNFSATAKYKHARWSGSAWVVSDIADVGNFVSSGNGSYFPSITFVPGAPNQVLLARGTKTTPTGTHFIEKYSTANSGVTWTLAQTIDSSAVENENFGTPRLALTRAYPVRVESGTTPFEVIGHDIQAYPNYFYGWEMYVRPLPLSLPVKRVPGSYAEGVQAGLRADLQLTASPKTGVYLPGTSGNYIQGPDLTVPSTGIRLEVDLALADWEIDGPLTLLAKESSNVKREARIVLIAAGAGQTGFKIGFYWSEDGSTLKFVASDDTVTPAPGQRVQLAVSFLPTTVITPVGAAAPQLYFQSFYRYSDDDPWTMLSVTQASPATGFFDSDSPWEIGSRWGGTTEMPAGVFYRAAVMRRSGEVLGEWRADRGGATQKDLQGNTWTIKPAVVVDTEAANPIDVPFDLTSGQATFNRWLILGNIAPGTGNLRLTYFTARKSETVASFRTIVGTLATTVTLSRIGLYTVDGSGNLTLVASTTNDVDMWRVSGGSITEPLTTPYAVTRGTRYAVGLLIVNSGTACTISGNAAVGSAEAAIAPRLSGFVASQTDLPSTVSVGSISNSGTAFYVALVP